MLSQEMRMAVLTLQKQGHGSRKIARDLGVGRNAVREVIASGRAEVARGKGPPHRLEPFVESLRKMHGEMPREHGAGVGGAAILGAWRGACRIRR